MIPYATSIEVSDFFNIDVPHIYKIVESHADNPEIFGHIEITSYKSRPSGVKFSKQGLTFFCEKIADNDRLVLTNKTKQYAKYFVDQMDKTFFNLSHKIYTTDPPKYAADFTDPKIRKAHISKSYNSLSPNSRKPLHKQLVRKLILEGVYDYVILLPDGRASFMDINREIIADLKMTFDNPPSLNSEYQNIRNWTTLRTFNVQREWHFAQVLKRASEERKERAKIKRAIELYDDIVRP